MTGGKNRKTIIPVSTEENRVQYANNTMPQSQFQLFRNVPVQTSRAGPALNPNTVSTGLKLSLVEEERNSSVTFCENMKHNNPVKMEIDRQMEDLGQYIKLQEENILKGVREIHQRQTASLLSAIEKKANRKLREKELQIEDLNRKNKELGDKINRAATEAQSWHYRAKYNESVVNVLQTNIQQLVQQNTAHACEGSGDSSEVNGEISCSNNLSNCFMKCRACSTKGVSVLILPCRHLCLCADCGEFVAVCPVCRVVKTASVHVYME